MAAAVTLDAARRVADALLHEGYLLYPYRASAQKNQVRWQFGVLAPPAAAGLGEDSDARVEVIVDAHDGAALFVELRFLRLKTRDDGDRAWDEAEPCAVHLDAALDELAACAQRVPVVARGSRDGDFRTETIVGACTVAAEPLPGPYGVARVSVVVTNETPVRTPIEAREDALRRALVSTHVLLGIEGGRFVSAIDPAEWVRPAVDGCRHERLFPVLAAPDDDVVLASPIILYDHPELAPESPGDLFDATEIDEILSLRTLALTDAEKAEARATDPRAAEIIDRVDDMPPEIWERLHGAIRTLRPVAPGGDASEGPGLLVGTKVRLRPGRRADAQDMFLAGRVATVARLETDYDGQDHVAVTLDDDPGADLHDWYGRYFYFAPDEVEPVV